MSAYSIYPRQEVTPADWIGTFFASGMGAKEGASKKINKNKKVKSLAVSAHSDPGWLQGFADLDSLGMSFWQPVQDLGLPQQRPSKQPCYHHFRGIQRPGPKVSRGCGNLGQPTIKKPLSGARTLCQSGSLKSGLHN